MVLPLELIIPPYFEWWHLPLVFAAGFLGESYGSIVGGGSVIIQWILTLLGMPLRSVVATDISAALGTDAGIISETKKKIVEHKKLVILMMVAILLGGIIGTAFLTSISVDTVRYLIILILIVLLAHLLLNSRRKKGGLNLKSISKEKYILLFVFMFFIGIYNNTISVGEGTFGKIALMSVLGMSFIASHGLKSVAIVPARIYSLVITTITGLIAFPYLITLWISGFLAGKYSTKQVKKIPDTYMRWVLIMVSAGYLVYLIFLY